MDFKTKWYSPENKPLDIPTFQNLQDVTGQAFDEFGNYVGKTEVPNQQLVIDKLTERQYYAPKEYSDDALRYAKAKVDKSFKPEDWYGMTQIKPHYKIGEHISAGYITALKSFAKPVAMLPTQLVYAGSVGLNALAKGDLQKTENLYRYSMQNWSDTLDKHGLGADPELSNMLTAKVGSIAGQTASSLLIAATVSSVGGLPAVATVFGSTQFADILEEGLEKGLPHDKAVLAAFLAAVPEGGLEAVGFKMWSGAASLNKTFRNLALAFLWEGAQEGSQQIAESTITNLFKIREQTFFDIVADVALSALVGGLVGLGGAAISGQVEQRNIALKKEIGMTERGNIVPQKPTDEKKAVPQKEGQVLNPSPEAEKQLIQQEIEEAKKTGDNKLYNTIKYVANANDVTDVDVIDKLYPVCRKMIADGGTIDTLLDILGNQIVAYKNQLQSGQADNQATQKAVEEIKLVTDPNRYDEWKESRKSELEKAGMTKEQANTLSQHISSIAENLSQRLGFDITEKKPVSFEPNLQEKAGTRGQITLGKTIAKIALNKNADPTTVEHEFFHYIDSVVKDAAQEGNKEAQKLIKKRDSIIKQAKAELKKNGVTKFPSDEEIIASAYEKWLWNGAKSEDATEQKLFEAIRDFFRDVYQSLRGLMGVRISPEADAYFRAMTGAPVGVSYQDQLDNILFQEGIKYDKNGKADINSPAFKKWFGNSKVVDENGKPLVVYHGTKANFEIFIPSKDGALGQGMYFATSEEYARGVGKNVMPVYLRIINPYIADGPITGNAEEFTNKLKQQGYDGIINPSNGFYVVFEPNQIKSVYNRGTFDTESPNIYYQNAYHGTPYRDIINFDYGKIGTGEGAQAHGWGFYFAKLREVAEEYRNRLLRDRSGMDVLNSYEINGKSLNETMKDLGFDKNDISTAFHSLLGMRDSALSIKDKIKSFIDMWDNMPQVTDWQKQMSEKYKKLLDVIEKNGIEEKAGQVYKVEIPENDVLLDEQAPLGAQSELVQNALKKQDIFNKPYNISEDEYREAIPYEYRKKLQEQGLEDSAKRYLEDTKEEAKKKIKENKAMEDKDRDVLLEAINNADFSKISSSNFLKTNPTGEEIYTFLEEKLGGARNASFFLESLGIKGISYDGQIDGRGFVIFNPQDIEMVETFYQGDNGEMFATHNMNLAGTKQALRLGGLAMPSMAIRKVEVENPMGFGDVSFVGHQNLITPKRGVEVYDRDAWTPSIWNNIRYSLSKAARTRIENILKKEGLENKTSMYVYNISENLYDATRNELALDLYMIEKGLPDNKRGDLYDSPEYIKWYNENFLDDATPYLWTENDDNTDMINRKLTLGNVMKVLRKKERAAGGYIGDHIFSVEELLKFFPQRFRNLKEIKKKSGNLAKSREQIREKIDALDDDFKNLVSSLRTEGEEKEYGKDRYAVGLAIINTNDESYQKQRLEEAGLRSDDNAISEINKFSERMKNEIPVDYFEVKPRRVVDFGEFAGVIMPKTQEYDSVAKQLKEQYGLPVLRIERGNIEQYKEALSDLQEMYPTTYFQETQDQLFRNDQATKHGNKVLDKAPTNQEVDDELEIIKSGRVEKAQEAKRGLGIIEGLGDALITVRQRVGVIDKRLKYAFDKLDYNEKMMESEYGKRTLPFIKKFRKLSDVDKKVLNYLIGNQQTERIREFLREHDMEKEYNDVRDLLDELFEEGNRAGMDMGFLQEYFPTKVTDYKSFISYLMGTDKWSEIELALNQIDPNHQLSDEERADAINSILRGYNRLDPVGKKGFQKERKILHKTPEMMSYYMSADEALMRYISGMTGALAIRKAFNVKGAFNSEESIGGVVNELIKSGQITQKEEPFIKRMIKARLNYARTAPIVSLLKNFGYLGTMNNITSAITQIGDLYANFYKYNFPTAMKAIFGKSEITKDDLYLDSVWEEFTDDGFTSVAVNKLFSAIGLNAFDKFGKNTAINGAWINLKERAKNNDVSLLEDLSAAFGSQAGKVLEDIKNNNITTDVKLLLWSQLADTQPIGKSGTPVGYLSSGYARILYQLKTYTVNQISLFYADGLYKIQKGIATKNGKLLLQGTGNLAKLALLLTVFNAGADVLKNLVMGRSIEISDTLLSNFIWNIGVSKYTFYRGQRDGYARALFENFLPPQVSMADEAYKDTKKIWEGKKEASDSIAVTYVPFGRMWYWWFGGGRTSEKKKGNKPFQVKL